MNYLGHAILSFGRSDVLVGNMIGDFVKGRNRLADYPDPVRKGIVLHRSIDSYTDAHPSTLRAKNYFREAYGLYAGVLVDHFWDYYLANDPRYFGSQAELASFARDTYATITDYKGTLPQGFLLMFDYMKAHDWLGRSRSLSGIKRSLSGLDKRARFPNGIEKAYEIWIAHYYELNQHYFDFIHDIEAYVKNQLNH